jgi:ABC-type molybdenum transport system ATPase subunit/photorepair protein PhrA
MPTEFACSARIVAPGQSLGEIRERLGVVSHDLSSGYQKRMSALDVVCSGFFDSVGLYRHCDTVQINRQTVAGSRLAVSALCPHPGSTIFPTVSGK